MTQPSKPMIDGFSRKDFLRAAAATGAVLAAGSAGAAAAVAGDRPVISCFVKFTQDLNYADMARWLRASGFDGVEAPVRKDGYILPEKAADELPRFAEALAKEGLKIMCVTTDIVSVDSPSADSVLKAAKALGVPRYRLGFLHYDLTRPVYPQLEALRPQIRELAAFNRAHGIMGVYQNHGEAKYVGASVWDFYTLIHDLPREALSFVYDTRHATVEGGTMWEATWNLVQSHIGYVSVKDFRWDGHKVVGAPLGTGQVDPAMFTRIRRDYRGDLTLHVEHLETAGTAANRAALAHDLPVLRRLLAGQAPA